MKPSGTAFADWIACPGFCQTPVALAPDILRGLFVVSCRAKPRGVGNIGERLRIDIRDAKPDLIRPV